MAKDPAMLFYTSDFLTGVTLLSMKERGQYITLLCLQQQMGHMSMQQMVTAVGKLSPALLAKFVQDEEGLWFNQRADVEIGKRRTHSEKQKENAMKRWGKTSDPDTTEDTTVIPRECHGICEGIAMAMPLENENENIQVISSDQGKTNRREVEFSKFWESYPKKVGKQAARKAFDKIPASVYPKLVPAIEAQKQGLQWKREDGRYIPNPATWLNQGRWDDEVAQAEPGPTTRRYMTAEEYEARPRDKVDMDRLKAFAKSLGVEQT